MKKIGFSNGALYRVTDKYAKSTIDIYKNCGSDVIETNIHDVFEVGKLAGITPYVKDFAYKSIHLPKIIYRKDEETIKFLDHVADYYKEIDADLILVHPDVVEDWSVFDDYKMNWATENMDKEKETYKTTEELTAFFKTRPDWKLVLDVNHCYTNDKTMKLARDMIDQFKDRIAQIHVSGYTILHDPLFQTRQDFILDYCKELDVPIIIESTFDSINDVAKEYEYVKEYLNT